MPVATTVQIGRGSTPGRADPDRRNRLLALIGQLAIKTGLGMEGAKVAQAIGITEGGLEGAVGDLDIGGSFGPFQFYAGGQLPQFAKALGVSVEKAKRVANENPEVAIEWALRGYLGNAIRQGLAKGYRGPQLATYAQRYGQVSESPERAGQNYAATFGDPSAQPLGIERGDTQGYRPTSDLVPNQFGPDHQLSAAEAASACGPAAAVAFARRWGRNPSMREAVDLAATVGWDTRGGMNGLQNQYRLVTEMAKREGLDVPIKMVTGAPDWDAVIHDAVLGNPVIVSTPIHYYVIDGYDPETGKFHVGQSGMQRADLKSAWVTANDIVRVDGQVNGALFADHPLVPGRSWAGRAGPTNRDDWSSTSRSTVNYGTQPGDEPKSVDDWAATPFETGHEKGLGQSAYPKRGGLPDYDPMDTPGWRAAKAIEDDFTYGMPKRIDDFMQQVKTPLYATRPQTQPFTAPAAQEDESYFSSAFARSLDPSALPDGGITAPRRRSRTGRLYGG